VDGAIRMPASVSTTQIGSTPKRSLCSEMNATSVTVEGRVPSRRKPLYGIPHNGFYADMAIMLTVGRASGGRGCSGGVSAAETVGIIAMLWWMLFFPDLGERDRDVDATNQQPEQVADRARSRFS
jgi:hypothetical protein